MRREADFFGDRELALVHVARTLRSALRLEDVLTEAAIDYAVEPDRYRAGVIFRRDRIGAFFYVSPETEDATRALLRRSGFQPVEPGNTGEHAGQIDYFSLDYVRARDRFRDAVTRAGGRLTALPIDAKGPAGEPLTIDIGAWGSPHPAGAFVHSCGVHGVEGFAGSAIQLQWLSEHRPDVRDDTAVLFVHAVNPFGMAWLRRVNERNVDLNRNCLAPDERYAGASEGYRALNAFLNPTRVSAVDVFPLKAAWLRWRVGMAALKQAVAEGQYEYPAGLFFGGTEPQEGPRALGQHLHETLARATDLVAIDVHTGLGPYGADTFLVNHDTDTATVERLRATFGRHVALLNATQGPAYKPKGIYEELLRRAAPMASVHFVGQEFGTLGPIKMLRALRDENQAYHHGSPSVAHRKAWALKQAFVPDHESWRAQVLARGMAAIDAGMRLSYAVHTAIASRSTGIHGGCA